MSGNVIEVHCKKCSEKFEVTWDELDVSEIEADDEREMGTELTYYGQAEVGCSHCDEIHLVEYTATEYPIGCPNFDQTTVDGAVFEPGFGALGVVVDDDEE